MANLETLELTINANAASATQGLSGLIGSLSALAGQVNANVGALKSLNAELEKLSGIGRMIKMPSFTSSNLPVIGSLGKVKEAGEKAAETVKEAVDVPNTRLEALAMKYAAVNEKMEEYAANGDALATANKRLQLDNVEKQFEREKAALDGADEKQKSFRQGLRDLGKDVSNTVPKFKALHKVLRIASTMLIRMGLRTLFKGVKEGFNNYYQYAKNTGNEFSKAMDNVSSAWSQLKNQMGAAIAPAIGAIIPILNGIASAAIAAFNALSQLFALLGGKGVWSKATAQVTAFDAAASKAGGGGGGLKEMLAKFDELNVIAQEGGGGGGGGTTADEYMSMFEEMYEFDSKIQAIANAIKEIVNWVKENLAIVYEAAVGIGMAILGWKISKAFEGDLATFGKILAGSALLVVSVVLSFDVGKKVGSGAQLNTMDILEGIAGAVAGAIGGYVIASALGASGFVGAAVGVGISVAAFITGVIVGKTNNLKWGSTSLTAEQVKAYVQSQFKFNIYADVELVEGKLNISRAARAHLEGDIGEFERELKKIKLNIDTSDATITKAKENLDNVLKQLNEYMTSSENLLTAYLQVMPYDETTQAGFAKDIFEANAKLKEYVVAKGEEIAKWYDLGMQNQWKGDEQDQVLALMEHVNNIMNAMTNATAASKTKTSLKVSMSNLTRTSAKDVLKEQKRILEEYADTLKESMLEQVSQLEGFAAAAMEAGMPEIAATYKDKAQWLVDTFESSMNKNLSAAKEPIKEQWISTLSDIFGQDIDRIFSSRGKFMTGLKTALSHSSEEAAAYLAENLNENINNISPIIREASELFGISGWELMGDETKKRMYDILHDAIGNDVIALLKNSLNISVDEIIKFSGYDAMATREKLNFISAIMKAYGAQEALAAAKNAGINIAQAISDGLNGKNPATKAAATDIVNQIDNALKTKGIKVPVNADLTVKINTLLELNTKVTMEAIKKAVVQSAKATNAVFSAGIGSAASQLIQAHAGGATGIPAGDLFIANERGAELVGSMNGKTTVANQGQIIEGIQRGVSEANAEQNALLRQQNELLRGILEKEYNVNFGASAAFGRTAKQSIAMYNGMVGG